MSAEAVANLRKLWEKLSFAHVRRVIAREPEDVLSIYKINPILGGHDYHIDEKRPSQLPGDPSQYRVSWRHYFGFTDGGIYFQRDGHNELDMSIYLTMDFSRWGNHQHGWEKPVIGTLIGGEVVETSRGKRFARWFECPPELMLLINTIRKGAGLTDSELGRQLLANDYPDKYWAIVRLALFDKVQPFVDELKGRKFGPDALPVHPAFGLPNPAAARTHEPRTVSHRGMFLPTEASQYVHTLSYMLNEPRWWARFQRLADQQGLTWSHPGLGGYCPACAGQTESQELDWSSRYDDYY